MNRNESQPVIELVVYTLDPQKRPDNEFITSDMNRRLKDEYAGFQHRDTFFADENAHLMMDYCLWENAELAHQAAENIQQDEHMMPFMAAISGVSTFGHYLPVSVFSPSDAVDSESVTKLVQYTVTEANRTSFLKASNALDQKLAAFPGFIERRIYQSIEDPSLFADIVRCDTLANAEAIREALQNDTEAAGFFGLIESVKHSLHFHPLTAVEHAG